jgi:hypothetical protein
MRPMNAVLRLTSKFSRCFTSVACSTLGAAASLSLQLALPATASAALAASPSVNSERAAVRNPAGALPDEPGSSGTKPRSGDLPSTTVDLSVSANGDPATSVTPGTVIALKAIVRAAHVPLTSGLVNFCDATVSYCTDIYLLGTASITANGTAVFKFVPSPGRHSYRAEFLQDVEGRSSASDVVTLDVGPVPPPRYSAATTLSVGGFPGIYSLTATVEGMGGTAEPTGNVSFVDRSFGDKVLATAPLGAASPGISWLISPAPATGQMIFGEACGDFNGDGIPDLAVLWTDQSYDGPYSVTILFGEGDGKFRRGPTTPVAALGIMPYMIGGDFNGDGKADLAILSLNERESENSVTVLLGNGNGTFGAPITSVADQQGIMGGTLYGGSMVAADFNGDGKMDLAIVGDAVSTGGLTILLGSGDGSFVAAGPTIQPNQGFGAIGTGDFNGDGIPDLVVASFYPSGGATVFLGKGDGTFKAGQQFELNNLASSIAVADFNGDGRLDFAVGYPFGAQEGLFVFLGKGDGTFKQAPGSPIWGQGVSLVTGDFNGDGKVDLAGIDDYYDQIDIYVGKGDGTFNEIVAIPNVSQPGNNPFQMVEANFIKSGVPGLAVLAENVNTASILTTELTETSMATVNDIAPVGPGTHNIEARYDGDSHYGKSVSAAVPVAAGLALPVITPASGGYTTEQQVTIKEAIPGATIYYRILKPGSENPFLRYIGPFSLLPYGGSEETIQAYAAEKGYEQSLQTDAEYFLDYPDAPKPTFSPAGGNYAQAQTVTITDAAPNATIYYATTGTNFLVYSGPITVSSTETISAFAVAPEYSEGAVASAQYSIGASQSQLIYTMPGTQSTGDSGDAPPVTSPH